MIYLNMTVFIFGRKFIDLPARGLTFRGKLSGRDVEVYFTQNREV
jgi:hypothetical protein